MESVIVRGSGAEWQDDWWAYGAVTLCAAFDREAVFGASRQFAQKLAGEYLRRNTGDGSSSGANGDGVNGGGICGELGCPGEIFVGKDARVGSGVCCCRSGVLGLLRLVGRGEGNGVAVLSASQGHDAGGGGRPRDADGSAGDGEGSVSSTGRHEAESLDDVADFLKNKKKKKNFGKNQRDRAKRAMGGGAFSWRVGGVPMEREAKQKAVFGEEEEDKNGADGKSVARKTLEEKWEVENRVAIARAKVAEEKAKKDLEFQRARDVETEVKKSRAKIMKDTESSKVATEKAFAYLKSTGNVPGFCETVVSGGVDSGSGVPGLSNGSSPDCTISPDSSASMHEFRKCQKELEDLKFENAKIKRQLEYGKLAAGEEAAFTINSDDDVSESVKEVIRKNTTDYYDVEIRDDSYGQDRAYTMYAKRISIPGADEFSFDY